MNGPFELGTDGPSVILVGVDGSDTSLRAAAYAAGLARRQGSRLLGVYVAGGATLAGVLPTGAALAAASDDELAATLRDLAAQRAAELGITFEFVIAHGNAANELARVADEVRADAVVVGSSEQAGHRIVGSVAVRLVRTGRWPVTVVP